MKVSHRLISEVAAAVLLLAAAHVVFAQTPQPADKPAVIDESVPPASDAYALGPDSESHPDIAKGKIFTFELSDSRIYPGTTRTIAVYIPAAYKADKPACVYVGLDSLSFNAPVVFDNLIARHAIPVVIGIGVSSGTVNSANSASNPRFDRSFEFDSRDDRLARFLLEEVLPAVEQRRTPDGMPIRLSHDANDRAIGGASTGGIAAFTAAWERPDAFHRVFSAIGTFVGMRGGEQYYVQVRKTEPKPLRVFMEDGVHDEWPGGPEMGDWWMSNLTMNRALEFAGYDVRHVWGAGTHSGNQATAIFPDAMQWLWRDWPAPIAARESSNPVLKSILEPGETWQLVADGCGKEIGLAANSQGQVFYRRGSQDVGAVGASPCQSAGSSGGLAFGADGKLYLAHTDGGIGIASSPSTHGSSRVEWAGLRIRDFTVRSNGDVLATAQTSDGNTEVWLLRSTGEKLRLAQGLKGASGIALSPDGLWLFVAQSQSRAGMSYRVLTDGTLDAGEPFYDFYVPAGADNSGAAQISMDRDGQAYVATRMGVQVFDRNGRVTAILPLPGNEAITGICFGDHDFHTLYVAAGGRIYRRKLRATGAPAWADTFKLPPWGAG